MDFASIIGFVGGCYLLYWAAAMGGNIGAFWDVPSVLIVLGGTVASAFINFPMQKIAQLFKVLMRVFMYKVPSPTEEIARMVKLAKIARSEGLLALENHMEEMKDKFLQKAVQLVVDGTEPDVVRDVLTIELEQLMGRHAVGKNILDQMGAMAPAYGMLGTLIGLIQMLGNMSDPAGLGAGMAVALITTLYGSLLSNLVFLPMAGKLDLRSRQEVFGKMIIIEGVAAIQAGLNPRLVEEKLKSFIAPKLRERLDVQLQQGKKAA